MTSRATPSPGEGSRTRRVLAGLGDEADLGVADVAFAPQPFEGRAEGWFERRRFERVRHGGEDSGRLPCGAAGECVANEAPLALLVQHHPADGPGAIGRELRAKGVVLREVRGYAGEEIPASVEGAAALLVMGGPMSADDVLDHPRLGAERRLVQSAIDARIPVLGVCLGSQLIARVLGGTVARAPTKEIGWHDVEREGGGDDPFFEGVPATFCPFHWHEDAIGLPPGATLRMVARDRGASLPMG